MLAAAAGGVDAFILSSELRGLTRVRGAGGSFPMTAALIALAADVRATLGASTKITYAADWTEYGGIVPAAGQLIFPLDSLWAAPDIDMVAIDWYPPLTDWRDGDAHADAAIANGPADPSYLASRVAAGEAFDWFYAGDAERSAQARLAVTDGAYGKPWVYRAKDLVNWWSNAHVARAGGVETGAYGLTPRMKPIWLAELGCPAVDGSTDRTPFPTSSRRRPRFRPSRMARAMIWFRRAPSLRRSIISIRRLLCPQRAIRCRRFMADACLTPRDRTCGLGTRGLFRNFQR